MIVLLAYEAVTLSSCGYSCNRILNYLYYLNYLCYQQIYSKRGRVSESQKMDLINRDLPSSLCLTKTYVTMEEFCSV